jgi:hypothetical protein
LGAIPLMMSFCGGVLRYEDSLFLSKGNRRVLRRGFRACARRVFGIFIVNRDGAAAAAGKSGGGEPDAG